MSSLTIGDTAPNLQADTTEGRIDFHEWLGDSWGILFSHPRDFTPVCTTELGYMPQHNPDLDSLQLTSEHQVSTPAQWQPGEDVIIAGSVSNDQARERYPDGWEEPKPYIRIVPAP